MFLDLESFGEQAEFVKSQALFSAIFGGRGSGKSVGGAQKSAIYCGNHKYASGLVVAPDYKRLHGSTLPIYRKFFGPLIPDNGWNKAEEILTTINGNQLYFRSTTDAETLRAYNVSFVHMDEGAYSSYEAFVNLIACMREQQEGNMMWLTSTPNVENPLNWTWHFFTNGEYPTFNISTLDNPFTGKEYKEMMLKTVAPDLAQIEIYGRFMPIAGNCFFDTGVIRSILDGDIWEPLASTDPRMGELPLGTKIYKPFQPGKTYVAGIDIAEGKQASDIKEVQKGDPDFQCLQIFERHSFEQVCTYHNRLPLDEFLYNCEKIGKYYEYPYAGLEINWDKEAGERLIGMGWPRNRMYHRESESIKGKVTVSGKAGWLTSGYIGMGGNRIPMLTDYEEAVRGRDVILHDKDCAMEHLSFIRDKNGRPSAASNAHDDYVMSGAIALQMRGRARFKGSKPTVHYR